MGGAAAAPRPVRRRGRAECAARAPLASTDRRKPSARIFGDNFFYILYFQEAGPADAELDRDPTTTLRKLMGGMRGRARRAPRGCACWRLVQRASSSASPTPDVLPDWLSQDEFDHYVDEFSRNGFTAPLNWYRCFDRNWALTETTPAATISVPSLFVGGSADPTLAYTPRHRVGEIVTGDYREVMIDGAGHWLQQERPGEVNRALLDFLSRLEL